MSAEICIFCRASLGIWIAFDAALCYRFTVNAVS